MLASPAPAVPAGPEWLHEVKWDGMRVLVEIGSRLGSTGNGLRIWSRNENDATVAFPELHGLAALADDAVLDGEVVARGEGVPTLSHGLA